MQKTSYQKMNEILSNIDINKKPKLLLHSCCAPCSSSVIERLQDYFDITVFYFNPNIMPREEYEKRRDEQTNFLKTKNIPFIEGDYDNKLYYDAIIGFENLGEKTMRCYKCYELRINETFEKAKDMQFDYYATTLTVSPHKLEKWVNGIGERLQNDKVKYLVSDFKKDNGYLRSIELSKIYDFYRQMYCGCNLKNTKE